MQPYGDPLEERLLCITIVGPTHPYKGGIARHTTELAHRMATAGHTVTLESWSAQYPGFLYPGQLKVDVPEGEPFPATERRLSWRRPDGWWRAGRRIRGADLAVLVVPASIQAPAYLTALAGLGRQVSTVALCHNVLPHERRPFDVPLMRMLLRRVDEVVVHSSAQAELARTLTSRTVRVAEMPAHLPPAVHACAASRTTEHRRLLFFGVVRPYKGLDVLLRALAAGPEDLTLTIAGEFWSGVANTEDLIARLGLTDRVEVRPGYVPSDQIPQLFAAADALVLPYRSATSSQNVWMAHEHGVPVIATRVGSFPEQVRDGLDGLLCEPDDVASLAGALRRFYSPGELTRLRAGVRPVDADPQWAAYLEIITAACRSSPGSGELMPEQA